MRGRDLWWLAGVAGIVAFGSDPPAWAWIAMAPVGAALVIALLAFVWSKTSGPIDGPPY